MNGEINNGFGLIRPPGRHAEQAQALGILPVRSTSPSRRIACSMDMTSDRIVIPDWDVHHGDGTQHRFESDRFGIYNISLRPAIPFCPALAVRGKPAGPAAAAQRSTARQRPPARPTGIMNRYSRDRVITGDQLTTSSRRAMIRDFGRFRRPPQ
ncbi:MAG: hypothetical protein U5P41_16170 [Gammaproteobacteria bacterium]|nr:hypothetical protein [Gammaproteobacteria bacterium]